MDMNDVIGCADAIEGLGTADLDGGERMKQETGKMYL